MDMYKPARGGKTVFGAVVGILMLETRFPRIPGDIGNAQTWPFPVLYKVVAGTTPHQAVYDNPSSLSAGFIAGAKELVACGADGITTTCGFLSLLQADLSSAVGVPVASSSLLQVQMVKSTLPANKNVGIITIESEALTKNHLECASVPLDTPIVGTDKGGEFSRSILNDEVDMDVEMSRKDLHNAAKRLMSKYPDTGAIVLECTNMAPYATDLRQMFNIPVYSIYTLILWFQGGLMPRQFDPRLVDTRYTNK